MGFLHLGKTFKHANHSVSHLFKHTGHSISKVVMHTGHTIGKGVGTIYKDTKSVVAYTGKHLIKDVDKISSTLSSPILIIGVGAIALILILNR